MRSKLPLLLPSRYAYFVTPHPSRPAPPVSPAGSVTSWENDTKSFSCTLGFASLPSRGRLVKIAATLPRRPVIIEGDGISGGASPSPTGLGRQGVSLGFVGRTTDGRPYGIFSAPAILRATKQPPSGREVSRGCVTKGERVQLWVEAVNTRKRKLSRAPCGRPTVAPI